MPPQPRGSQQVQIQIATGYTLSASGNSSASAKVLLAKELSSIQSPDAPAECEICGLVRCAEARLSRPAVVAIVDQKQVSFSDKGRNPAVRARRGSSAR